MGARLFRRLRARQGLQSAQQAAKIPEVGVPSDHGPRQKGETQSCPDHRCCGRPAPADEEVGQHDEGLAFDVQRETQGRTRQPRSPIQPVQSQGEHQEHQGIDLKHLGVGFHPVEHDQQGEQHYLAEQNRVGLDLQEFEHGLWRKT